MTQLDCGNEDLMRSKDNFVVAHVAAVEAADFERGVGVLVRRHRDGDRRRR